MTFTVPAKSEPEGTSEAAERERGSSTFPVAEGATAEAAAESSRRFQEGVKLQEDLTWFLTNLPKISEELGEQWVAVRGKQIIAQGDTVKAVRDEMQRLGVKRAVLTRSGLNSWDPVRW